ncbi:hypothetical protein BGZ52_003826 [Haplosporangium bisporale]|nr:hypothetical protein BGZ52_003826 [Haplosporangium bisporale]
MPTICANSVIAGHEIRRWTAATDEAFTTRAKCLITQYGNFTIKGPDGSDNNINGRLTPGESIANSGGCKKPSRPSRPNSTPIR